MDYKHAAQQVLDAIGGASNIVSAAHCATRLRLVIADNDKVDKKALENAEGAKGVFEAQGQLQIIFGTGTVNKVYDEFTALAGIGAATKEEVKQAAAAKAPWYQQAIKTLGDIFVPIIPAIVASGFLMGIMEALNFMVNNGFVNIDTSGSLYVFAQLFSNTAYTFLPILIAFSAAKVFGGNPFLGAVIGMIMIHPNLQNAWTVASEGVQTYQPVFGGLYSIPLVGYQGHVIPVIIAVWLMSQIEKRLHKVVPAMFDLFVTPLVSVFVTGYLTLAVIGPIFTTVEDGIINGVQALIQLPYGIGSFVMGGLYAITVVAGIHHMYTLIDVGSWLSSATPTGCPWPALPTWPRAVPLWPSPSRARTPRSSPWPCPPHCLPAWASPSQPSSASTCATSSPLSAAWRAVPAARCTPASWAWVPPAPA